MESKGEPAPQAKPSAKIGDKTEGGTHMNAILSILVCFAMLFSGGAALPAQP